MRGLEQLLIYLINLEKLNLDVNYFVELSKKLEILKNLNILNLGKN
jgi:hypothetical protein